MNLSLLTTSVRTEHDVLLTRQRARQLADLLGFDPHDQTRIATAVSEITRNAVQHAGGGKVEFQLASGKTETLRIHIQDEGPGIQDVEGLLRTGTDEHPGASIRGVRRLMDEFRIETNKSRGTTITLGKHRPKRLPPIHRQDIARITSELVKRDADDPLIEMRRQNQELLRTLEELRLQQEARESAQQERDHLFQWVQREQAQLKTVLEHMPAGVLILDVEAKSLRFANREAERIYRELSIPLTTPIAPDSPLSRALHTGEVIVDQLVEVERRDGGRSMLLFNAAPLRTEDGRIEAAVAAFYDVTERINHAREIEALNLRLERSVQETHHRVKNNLQVISALVELQVDPGSGTVPGAAVERIINHTQSMAAIHDLLTHEAKMKQPTDTVSVTAVLGKLMPLLEATAGGRPIRWELEEFSLPVREGTSLSLLTSEIVSNSVKHGAGAISVTLTTQEGKGLLVVQDEGPGFRPGFDWNTAASTGFTLIQSAAYHDLAGTIAFENRPGGGAQVTVTFPLP